MSDSICSKTSICTGWNRKIIASPYVLSQAISRATRLMLLGGGGGGGGFSLILFVLETGGGCIQLY